MTNNFSHIPKTLLFSIVFLCCLGNSFAQTRALKVTPLGQQSAPIPADSYDKVNISSNIAVITFQNDNSSKYAFDNYLEYYNNVSLIKDHYEHLNNAGSRYDVGWKFLEVGKSDKIKATIQIKTTDTIFKPEKVIFTTPQGTKYNAEYSNNTYTLSLVGGVLGDAQEIYAFYKENNSTYHTLGKLKAITYEPQKPKVVIVQINNNTIDGNNLRIALDRIYNPVGINWTLQLETMQYSDTDNFFDKNSGLLHAYNDKMRNLINYYKAQAEYYDKNACYIFILNDSGDGNNRDAQGFMPRGKQFGFIFKKGLSDDKISNTIAHELGHGKWKLKHTFDKDTYGNTASTTQGTTNNLMDYNNAEHIAKWQWDILSQPALFDGIFDSDEDGMAQAKREYYITIDGKKAYKFDLKDFEEEFKNTKELDVSELNDYLKTIELYVISSDKPRYTISTQYVRNDVDKGNISELYFDNQQTQKTQDILFQSSTNPHSDGGAIFYSDGIITYPIFRIKLTRITPNIAYKQGENNDFIIKYHY